MGSLQKAHLWSRAKKSLNETDGCALGASAIGAVSRVVIVTHRRLHRHLVFLYGLRASGTPRCGHAPASFVGPHRQFLLGRASAGFGGMCKRRFLSSHTDQVRVFWSVGHMQRPPGQKKIRTHRHGMQGGFPSKFRKKKDEARKFALPIPRNSSQRLIDAHDSGGFAARRFSGGALRFF